jgi:2-oxoglutarate ferredoxin oxidoreductase subunit alpha
MIKKNLSIVLSGAAGQGIKTIEELITQSLRSAGYHFFSTSEVMSRVRGGNNTTEIRIGSKQIQSYSDVIDVLIVMGKNSTYRVENRITKDTLLVGDSSFIDPEHDKKCKTIKVSFNKIAEESGGLILTNTVIFGFLLGLLKLPIESEKENITQLFKHKGTTIVEGNVKALLAGYAEGSKVDFPVSLPVYEEIKTHKIMSGNDAITIGAIAGGCNFVAAYPMSPSTEVLLKLAHQAEEFGIVVEQAEDEIAAINMAIGSWYAGARGLTTTSGGGFALMEEGISLSGMTETPVVVHLAQRPGPATGLPTRTEQADLNLAIYSGHGEFPKIVLAPGSIEDGIRLTHKAFNLAAKFRVPVIILTDQFYLESYLTTERFDVSTLINEGSIDPTPEDFKTYKLTPSGISPRGIPGYGNGFVCVDSDEHDEWGRLTEDSNVRIAQMDKRLHKINSIIKDAVAPEIIGSVDKKIVIIGWGSTYGVIKEAMGESGRNDITFAHFKQVFPLPTETQSLLENATKIVVVENNATGQFAKLLRQETGIKAHETILQYNGNPFSLEFLIKKIKEI